MLGEKVKRAFGKNVLSKAYHLEKQLVSYVCQRVFCFFRQKESSDIQRTYQHFIQVLLVSIKDLNKSFLVCVLFWLVDWLIYFKTTYSPEKLHLFLQLKALTTIEKLQKATGKGSLRLLGIRDCTLSVHILFFFRDRISIQ